ncbi:hypothetical protein NLM24_31225 [Nocardia zapadnayensis]|nr:hypothetical protein [Nocardia zapadnayensis]
MLAAREVRGRVEAWTRPSGRNAAEMCPERTRAPRAPKPVDPQLLATVDVVVVMGREARLDPGADIEVRTWETDEPSTRGIEGIERMQLVRDDIAARVEALLPELLSPTHP